MPVDRKGRSPGYLPQGHKESVRTEFLLDEKTGLLTPNTQTLHWSGQQDATVKPKRHQVHIRRTEKE